MRPARAPRRKSCEMLVAEGFDGERRRAAGRRRSRHVHQEARARRATPNASNSRRPYLEYLLDRAAAGHNLNTDEGRVKFLAEMLPVAGRIPDAAMRDRFADRLAFKARVTEEVVRAEIRKAAVQKQTDIHEA